MKHIGFTGTRHGMSVSQYRSVLQEVAERTPLVRRKSIRRGSKRSKYARRQRSWKFMAFVKTLACSVHEEWPLFPTPPCACEGPIEADHVGERGLGQKCDDTETIPMCMLHHRQRTDHTGDFKHVAKEDERSWKKRAILRTQTLWLERSGESIA